MRFARSLALLAVLAAGRSARAEEATGEPAAAELGAAEPVAAETAAAVTLVATAPAPAPSRSLHALGIMVDAGIPDGIQGSLVLRPWKALRLSAGGGYNMISKGVRVGATLLPFGRGPSGTLEAGHYFEGNASGAAVQFFGPGVVSAAFGPTLQRVGYDFVNAHVGLDFGWRRVTFYVHGGMSYVQSHVHNIDQIFHTNATINGLDANGTQVSIPQGATVKYLGPSGKIGLIVYFG